MFSDKLPTIPKPQVYSEAAENLRKDFESTARKAGICASGISQGIAEQSKELLNKPLTLATDIASGAALGLAISALPKWAAVPVAVIASAPLVGLANRSSHALKETGEALSLADSAPEFARKKIADSLGPVIVEGAYIAGSGLACSAGARILQWRYSQAPELPLHARFESNEPPLRSTRWAKMFNQPSMYFPKLNSIPKEIAALPVQRLAVQEFTLKSLIQPVCNDEVARRQINSLNHIDLPQAENKLAIPMLSRDYQRVVLSTRSASDSISQLYERSRNSVVRINAGSPFNSSGTGFFVSHDGLIATAAHVVQGKENFSVNLADGSRYKAKLLGSDMDTDLALLKISKQNTQPLPIAETDRLTDGESLYVIGHPRGGAKTFLSPGRYHRKEQYREEIDVRGKRCYAGETTDVHSYFATTYGGNSGGPVLNAKGEVIAVHVRAMTSRADASIGYGVSSLELRNFMSQLLKNSTATRKETFHEKIKAAAKAWDPEFMDWIAKH